MPVPSVHSPVSNSAKTGKDEKIVLKTEYHKRPPIEAVNSFLKTQFSMANNKVRGLSQVTFYALCSILCLVLIEKQLKGWEDMKRQYHRLTSIPNLGTKRRANQKISLFFFPMKKLFHGTSRQASSMLSSARSSL